MIMDSSLESCITELSLQQQLLLNATATDLSLQGKIMSQEMLRMIPQLFSTVPGQGMLLWSQSEAQPIGLESKFSLPSQTEPDNRRHLCSQCSKEFATMSNLKQHMQVHEQKNHRQNFSCHICKKSYLYKCSLNKHLKTHSGDIVPLENESQITLSGSGASEVNLEPKSSKKIKIEGDFSVEVKQETPQSLKEIIELNRKQLSGPTTETIQFTYNQPLIGGGSQLLRITIEPTKTGNDTQWFNCDDYLSIDPRSLQEISHESKLHVDKDFIDTLFRQDNSISVSDLGNY